MAAHFDPSLLDLHTRQGVICQLNTLFEEYCEISKGALSISDFELSDSTHEKSMLLKKAIDRYNHLHFLTANLGKSVEIGPGSESNTDGQKGMLISFTSDKKDSYIVNIKTESETINTTFPQTSIISIPIQ